MKRFLTGFVPSGCFNFNVLQCVCVCVCVCVSECPSVSVGLYLHDSSGTWGDQHLVFVGGFCVCLGFFVSTFVSLSLCASVWVPASACLYKCCPLVVEASLLAFSLMSEKFLAVPSLFSDLSASTLPSQRVRHKSVFTYTYLLDSIIH